MNVHIMQGATSLNIMELGFRNIKMMRRNSAVPGIACWRKISSHATGVAVEAMDVAIFVLPSVMGTVSPFAKASAHRPFWTVIRRKCSPRCLRLELELRRHWVASRVRASGLRSIFRLEGGEPPCTEGLQDLVILWGIVTECQNHSRCHESTEEQTYS